jgi:predicted phosphoribosyltransferase
MIKKIGHPGNPEFAIGAVTLEDYIVDTHKATISGEYIAAQIQKIRQKLERQYNHFTGTRKPIELANKTIIVIDDGIATGNTILAAIRILRRHQPARIVVAVPVAPTETARRIRREVDEFICPYIPDTFYGVGYYYNDFNQVSDAEVIHLLADMTPTINHPT